MRQSILCALFALLPPLLPPGFTPTAQQGDWYGELQYGFRKERMHQKPHSDSLKTRIERLDESDIRHVTIRFCGIGDTKAQSTARYDYNYTYDSESKEGSESCKGTDGQPYTVKPGNGRISHMQRTGKETSQALQDLTTGFQVFEDGTTFYADAHGIIRTQERSSSRQQWIWVCTNKTDVAPGEHSAESLLSVSFSIQGKIQDGISRGEKIPFTELWEDGTLEEKVSWFIASPCGRIRDQLNKALALAERYGDPARQAKAKPPQDLNDQMDNETGATVAAWVDPKDCQLKDYQTDRVMTFDEIRRALSEGEYLCSPPAIIDSIIQHERTHMKQCMKDEAGKYSNPTAQSLGQYEKEAYCVEARGLC